MWKGGAEPFSSSCPSSPTCPRLWEGVIASLWPPARGSLPGPEFMHYSAHSPLLVQHSVTAHTGLKERFQRPWAAILNVVVRTTPPGGGGEHVTLHMSGPGFEKAPLELLICSPRTLLTARTTIDARQGPRVSWSGNMAFPCWAGFLQPSEGRRATGSSRGRLWEYGPVTGSSQDGRVKGEASQHPKAAHRSLQRTRDKLMKEPNDGSTERSSTGVPPSFSAAATSIKLCVLFI